MSTLASGALPHKRDDSKEQDMSESRTARPGGQEARWKVVATTAGILPAEIIAGRLRSEGIPARAWQEGAGEALGVTVGLLGNGHVEVPESFAERAEALLAEEYEDEEE